TLRPVALGQLGAAAASVPYELAWTAAVAGPTADLTLQVVDLATPAEMDAYSAQAARAAAREALRIVQDWLAEERDPRSRLVLRTRGAVATRDGERIVDLAAAAGWGLVRSAQTEYPDRFVLLDIDESADAGDGDGAVTGSALAALVAREPQLALRDGRFLVPRLVRPTSAPAAAPVVDTPLAADALAPAPVLDVSGTVVVTGGTGVLGGLVARHLVVGYGVSG